MPAVSARARPPTAVDPCTEPVAVASALLRALGDATRLRCALLLAREGELCVCELVAALAMSQPKVSRHLASLRQAGVVVDRRDARWVHYRLADDLPAWVRAAIDAATGTLGGDHRDDLVRLAAMNARPGRNCR